jgi:hypothetical protein
MSGIWPWVTLALLGAYHGLNPGMGWLFALSLGLQEKTRLAILKALLPISLGHAVAISLTILALRIVQELCRRASCRSRSQRHFLAWGFTGCCAPVIPEAGE